LERESERERERERRKEQGRESLGKIEKDILRRSKRDIVGRQ
jgi:hypothetical protein